MRNEAFVSKLNVRKKKVSISFLFWVGVCAVIASGAIWGIDKLLTSDNFKVKDIQFRGLGSASRDRLFTALVANIVEKDLWSNLLGPEHLLFWTDSFEEGIGKTMPMIEKIEIKKDQKKRTIELEVTEKELKGIWCRGDDTCAAFDAAGIAFDEVPEPEGALILKIIDEARTPLILGGRILKKEEWVKNVFQTLNTMERMNFGVKSVYVFDENIREWMIETESATQFFFSLEFVPKDLPEVLRKMTQKVKLQDLVYLDFRVQSKIFYKTKE